ncbi:hypothetical protein AGDE_15599 [Angomonas deanei]|uniref:Uncharacterized protein n=1 Tax=Angomonas deanei TaxID=59799 RepID=A0A7G2C128_9TRYP|nr:hypothetical protein AGDE_15599 [Angomonas deanei]CAD2212901.1 hypothetical protein, conserved [Angomonas deanei]|eukprot:EPY18783.1 hypothetical protein AGDE_15599 [Angomonas deanei]
MDQRQESLDNLLDHLEKIEQPNALQESLFSIFSMLQSKEATHNEVLNGEEEALSRAILQWMMEHELGDHRLGVFAGVVDRFHLPVHLNEDCMTETFCWCWSEYSSGEKGRASRHLAELATTTGFCPLSIRKKCIDLTLLHTSAVEYQWVAFLLELQQRLYNVIEALSREAYVEPEVLIRLSGHYLGEKQLLETCREYHHVGGAVLELDLLGKQSNVSLPTLHGAISATLNFLCSQSGSPSAAVVSVLETHFHNFQVTLPLIPFVDFYLSQEGKLADLVDLFYQEGVPPQDVFTLLHHMLDTQDKSRNPYPIVEVVQLMVQQVLPKITDNSLRRRYIRHTVGTLEKIDGEYRRFFLTPQELESLEELEREVYQMSEAIQ